VCIGDKCARKRKKVSGQLHRQQKSGEKMSKQLPKLLKT
jgi:hypothetical protein